MNTFGDLLGSQSKQSRSVLEEKKAPTADVRDLISSKVASSSARDDMDVKKEDDADQLGGGGWPPGSAQTERRGECSEEHRPCSEIVTIVIFL